MFCFADATGEALSGLLRPGNAGANTVADHVSVLDAAAAQLPAEIAAGHHAGDEEGLVGRPLVMRTDSAGCTQGFVWACRARNIGFFVVARSNAQVHSAIFDTVGLDEIWEPALHQDGSPREGAAVADLSELVDLSECPRALGSSCAANRCIRAPSTASFPHSSSATGATTAIRMARRSNSTRPCAPTRMSSSTFSA